MRVFAGEALSDGVVKEQKCAGKAYFGAGGPEPPRRCGLGKCSGLHPGWITEDRGRR